MKVVARHKAARSEAREALAAAIKDHAAAIRAVHRARDSVERAINFRAEAEAKLEAASSSVQKARELQAKSITKAATKPAGSLVPADAMRIARAAEADAQDQLEAAGTAVASCQDVLALRKKS